MKIRWTVPAARALEAISDYIAAENPKAAFVVVQRIVVSVDQLKQHPKIGRAGRVRGTSELVIPGTPYIVPYRIKNREIQILTVYHTSRRWPERFE